MNQSQEPNTIHLKCPVTRLSRPLTVTPFGEGILDIASHSGGVAIGSNNASTVMAGTMWGDGSTGENGTGALTLSGTNIYTGDTTITTGTLQIRDGSTTGSAAGNINDKASLIVNRFNRPHLQRQRFPEQTWCRYFDPQRQQYLCMRTTEEDRPRFHTSRSIDSYAVPSSTVINR